MDVESAIIIGILTTALFSVIGLLATALFQLRGRIDQLESGLRAEINGLRSELAGLRVDVAGLTVRFEAHLTESHG